MIQRLQEVSRSILSTLNNSKNIVIITHARPDGDCLGAAFAVREYCKSINVHADIVNNSPLPQAYAFIDNDGVYNDVSGAIYDTVVVLDCANDTRYQDFNQYLKKAKQVIWIDHHLDYGTYGDINYVVPAASSTCELVYDILSSVFMSKKFATYLLVGLSTDTGHFMHQNTSSKVLSIASELVKAGAPISEISKTIYKSRSYNKSMLISRAIKEMQFFHNREIAYISLTREIFEEYDITANETEGIIDYAMAIHGVSVAVCMSENNANQYKVSLRSRTEDVAEIAGQFGGGGHKLAAGCQVFGYKEDVIDKVVRVIINTIWTE